MRVIKRIFYFFYQWAVFFPLFLLATLLTALMTIVGCFAGNYKFWGFYPASLWCRFTCRLALAKVKVVGREKVDKNSSYVFVANHQGAFDIFLIYGYLGCNFRWLMKESLRKIPLVGTACASAGHIFIDRTSGRGIVMSLRQAKEKLNDGISTVVFPEGSRTKDGKMHEFKKGAFQIAFELKRPIVPLTIDGSFGILKSGSYLLNRGKMTLTIHAPVSTQNLTSEDMPGLMNEVWHIIADPLNN
ncbi:MAG: 1-acyl-sn-glycerol-3-phosphate acyltransferase [Candidatus Azobacteroides sp.]|nr:1-acyl-sn-glycerol-3-phosphate acyltransferase [Candidatus Azobacteroides sp.]